MGSLKKNTEHVIALSTVVREMLPHVSRDCSASLCAAHDGIEARAFL